MNDLSETILSHFSNICVHGYKAISENPLGGKLFVVILETLQHLIGGCPPL